MSTVIFLCASVFAADAAVDVQPCAYFGAGSVDLPEAMPPTDWLPLKARDRRLYSSMHAGFILDGLARKHGRMHRVRMEACLGFPMNAAILLKSREGRLLRLSERERLDHVFIALQAPISALAKQRAKSLKAEVKSFRLELDYHGEQGKPFYGMRIQSGDLAKESDETFRRVVQVSEAEACRIIDHLAQEGLLHQGLDARSNIKIPAPSRPGYTMNIVTRNVHLYSDLGWKLPMIQRLDRLRDVLPPAGVKEMKLLLARMSGLRSVWTSEATLLELGEDVDGVRLLKEDGATVIDVTSRSGIGKAAVRLQRNAEKWPQPIVCRLHLTGLESFQVLDGELAVEWSVASGGDNATRAALREGRKETAINSTSPYYTKVRIVGGNKKVPLKGGHFEVRLPKELFAERPDEIVLKWIDFYR